MKKYKVVVKTRNKTYVKRRGFDKAVLEDYALELSKKKPFATIYVVASKSKAIQ